VLRHSERHNDALRTWAKALLVTKPFKLVAVAIANKMARIVFAMLTQANDYSAKAVAA
jgi:transposase